MPVKVEALIVVTVVGVRVNARFCEPATVTVVRLVEEPSSRVIVFAEPLEVIAIVSAPFAAAAGCTVTVPAVWLLMVKFTVSVAPASAASVKPKVVATATLLVFTAVEVEPMFVKIPAFVEFEDWRSVIPVAASIESVPPAVKLALTVSIFASVGCTVTAVPIVALNVSAPAPPSRESSPCKVMPVVEL